MEAVRDRIMWKTGTDEPWYLDREWLAEYPEARAANWRKPLSLSEISQMAPTPDVRQRQGRG
jgi:hypothetical protein